MTKKATANTATSSGGVYKRAGSPFWWIWFRDSAGNRQYVSSKTKNETEAHVELNRILGALRRGKAVKTRRDSFSRIEDQLLSALREQERSSRKETSTIITDVARIRNFIGYCEVTDIRNADEVNTDVLQDYLTWLVEQDGRSPVTANRYVDAVRGVLPNKISVKKNRENPGRGQEIPQDIIEKILEAADPICRSFLILLAETGLRTGHLCKAETAWVKDYRFKDGDGKSRSRKFLAFPTSASNSRKSAPMVPLNDTAVMVIAQLPCKGKYLFDNGHDFPLFNKDKIYDRWRTIKAKVGFKDYRPYDLRHTFAIREIMRTGDFYYVSKSLGHKNASTTLNYYQNLSNARLAERASGSSITGVKLDDLK
ncbi:MAG: tyrosine-type recombinase/integrase [Candidatus Zixiibacteriota bacterium]